MIEASEYKSKHTQLDCPCYINMEIRRGRSADGTWILIAAEEFEDCKIDEILENYRNERLNAL